MIRWLIMRDILASEIDHTMSLLGELHVWYDYCTFLTLYIPEAGSMK